MVAYSMLLRKQVLADSDAGMPTKQVAERYGVSRTWVRSLKRRRETGEFGPRKGKGGRKPKFDRARLAELVRQDNDATLAELRDRLGVKCSLSALHKALAVLKITFKKKRFTPPSAIVRTWPNAALAGESNNSDSIPGDWCSSMKPGARPT